MLENPFYYTEDAKEQRRVVRAWCVRLILILFAGGLVVWGTGAWGAPFFKSTDGHGRSTSLRLLEEPCTHPKVVDQMKILIKPEYIPKFKAAVLNYGGRDWASCWIEIQGHILSIDEEGAPFNPKDGVPVEMFKEDVV